MNYLHPAKILQSAEFVRGSRRVFRRMRNSWIVFSNAYYLKSNLPLRPQRMFNLHSSMTCLNWSGNNVIPSSTQVAVSSLPVHTACVLQRRYSIGSNMVMTLNTDSNVARFSLVKPAGKVGTQKNGTQDLKRPKMSKKAKVNQLKWYRLKAKKTMKSPNPEVRIRYKLEKAKRKEEWLIEKLRKFDVPKGPDPVHDPEILTVEERFYLKRTGEKKKNYVPVGRRGVFGGVVLNMHLHWKNHETVKVICKPCRPGLVHEYAMEIARLSKGIIIDIKYNTIIFYRGKNYVQPEVMSPPNTLSKQKALEKYKFEQSLEHTSQFIEKLEKELEEYHNHIAVYTKNSEEAVSNNLS